MDAKIAERRHDVAEAGAQGKSVYSMRLRTWRLHYQFKSPGMLSEILFDANVNNLY